MKIHTLRVGDDTHEDIMLLKIQCKAKNAEWVVKRALTLLKKKLREEQK